MLKIFFDAIYTFSCFITNAYVTHGKLKNNYLKTKVLCYQSRHLDNRSTSPHGGGCEYIRAASPSRNSLGQLLVVEQVAAPPFTPPSLPPSLHPSLPPWVSSLHVLYLFLPAFPPHF
jgi:hypothetical protein